MCNLQVVVLVLWSLAIAGDCKTVHGILSSRLARLYQGQYITKFCFHGKVHFSVYDDFQGEVLPVLPKIGGLINTAVMNLSLRSVIFSGVINRSEIQFKRLLSIVINSKLVYYYR